MSSAFFATCTFHLHSYSNTPFPLSDDADMRVTEDSSTKRKWILQKHDVNVNRP